MLGAFGRYGGKEGDRLSPEDFNRTQQVFESSAYDTLWEAVKERHAAGGPVWYRAKLAVQDNAFLGIQGGWEVDFFILFNCTQSK